MFVRANKSPQLGADMCTILARKETKGEVGLEIEVEGARLPKNEEGELRPYWQYHHDGSLRGEDNAEYVLNKPLSFKEIPKALDSLWDVFGKYNSRIDESNRTSVHVHLNCQKFYMNRLTSFLALYFTFEEILTQWCGEHRVGNLFCLRAVDAPGIVTKIREFIRSDGGVGISEHLHYSAMNFHALKKFGSLEVRTLRGVSSPDIICQWVSILERLYTLSAEFSDPRDICGMFSGEGPTAFFGSVLGEKADLIRQDIPFTDSQIRDSLYNGIRLAQDLCYCRDWDRFKELKVDPDPFGRAKQKIMTGMTQMLQSLDGHASPLPQNPNPFIVQPAQWIPMNTGANPAPVQIITSEIWDTTLNAYAEAPAHEDEDDEDYDDDQGYDDGEGGPYEEEDE